MIISFGDRDTESLYHDENGGRKFRPEIRRPARRKLDMLDAATSLDDLRAPRGNRLEALKGEWAGYYSIRVNDQWRVVFQWDAGNASRVRVIDYH
jgi:proteic killer suppression protein